MKKGTFIEYDLSEKDKSELSFFHSLFFEKVGYFKNAYEHYISRDDPDSFLIILCTKGKGYLKIYDHTYEIRKGMLCFTFPHIPHTYGADKENPWSIYWAHFLTGDAQIADLMSRYKITPETPVMEDLDYTQLSEGFQRILTDIYRTTPHGLRYRQSIFSELIFKIFFLRSQMEQKDSWMNLVIEYVHSHLAERLTLDDIANALHVSKYHLSHKFSKELGISVRQYIMEVRMNQAKTLLVSTQKDIREIAELCGYDNSMYFSNAFKTKTDCSPTYYRKNMLGK